MARSFLCLVAASCLLACATPLPAQLPRPAQAPPRMLDRVVLMTVDGLRPVDCLRLPTLSRLAREGAFAALPDGALSVTPSVTYPAHTSMVTGSYPARHGITTNQAPDPTSDAQNQAGWRWYAEDVRVPTLWSEAFDAGLRTAVIAWPVTVGARATLLLPEYWRAGTAEDTKLVRALSSPGFLALIEHEHPEFALQYRPPKVEDAAVVSAALTALAHARPHLLLLHIWQTDDAQHKHGPDSAEANAALATADAQVARLLQALMATPEWPRTVLVIASDHGFARVTQRIPVQAHLTAAGVDDALWASLGGGFAYLYARAPEQSAAAAATAQAYFQRLLADGDQGIAHVLTRAQLAERHGDPDAVLALEALPGFVFKKDGPAGSQTAPDQGGTHGYLPEREEMRATLIFYGPKVAPNILRGARLVDIAPTIAPWLGLRLPEVDGRLLPVTLR